MSDQQHVGDEQFVRRYEYEDGVVIAADVGESGVDASVDIVGRTVIVVVDAGDGVTETEFELPATDGGDPVVETNNGILTITLPN
jgi:hypothetical protein